MYRFKTWLYIGFLILCMVVFITPIAIVLLIFGKNDHAHQWFHTFVKRWWTFYLSIIKEITYDIKNLTPDTLSRPAVIISNHQSYLDLVFIMIMFPKTIILTNNKIWQNPLFHPILRFLDFRPIIHGIDSNMQQFETLCKKGYSVMVFPEGTRSADCKIHHFRTGAFHIAQSLKLDTLPVYMRHPGHILPKKDLCLHPGHIEIEIGARVPYNENITPMAARHLWQRHYTEVI